MRTRAGIAGLLLLLVACAGEDPPLGGGAGSPVRVLPMALEKPDFTFTDVRGEPFDFRRETEGYLTLLFFGYTNCPDVCPVHMANLAAVLRDLPVEQQRRTKVVFVTTDPDRDTPDRLGDWLASFHPSFVGLRGPLDEVHAAEAALMLPASVVESPHGSTDGDEDYFVGHASAVVAFSPAGTSRVMFPWGTRQQDFRRDLPRILEGAVPESP